MNVKPNKRVAKEKGATAVEFAIIVALLLTLLLGILEVGRILFYMNTASEATRWGARCAVVSSINDDRIKAGMIQKLPLLASDNINIDYSPSGCSVSSCRSITVSIQNVNVETHIPFIPFNISIPSFSTTLPRESLETIVDTTHPNCIVPSSELMMTQESSSSEKTQKKDSSEKKKKKKEKKKKKGKR